MRRLVWWSSLGVLAALAQGCGSDCTIEEATGSLSAFAGARCSTFGSTLTDGSLDFGIDLTGNDEELLNELRVAIPAPVIVGLRGSGTVTAKLGVDFFSNFGGGVADYVITGVRREDETSTYVVIDIDLDCPRLDTVFGRGTFRGHVAATVSRATP